MYRISGYDIELTRGDTLVLRIDLKGRDLPLGTDAIVTVKKRVRDAEPVIQKRFDASSELLTIMLDPAETDLLPGVYFWDVRLQIPLESGGYEVYTPMEYASFTVLEVVGQDLGTAGLPEDNPDVPVLQVLISQAKSATSAADAAASEASGQAQAALQAAAKADDAARQANEISQSFQAQLEALNDLCEDRLLQKSDDIIGDGRFVIENGNLYATQTVSPYFHCAFATEKLVGTLYVNDGYHQLWTGASVGGSFVGMCISGSAGTTNMRRIHGSSNAEYANAAVNTYQPLGVGVYQLCFTLKDDRLTVTNLDAGETVFDVTFDGTDVLDGIAFLNYQRHNNRFLNLTYPWTARKEIDSHADQLKTLEERTQDRCAEMYLKGAAPKSFAQKIGLICAGQSNADGRVPSSELPSHIALPMEGCYLTKNTDGSFAALDETNYYSDGQWAFDLVACHYLTQVDGAEVYLVKKALGGTSIDPSGEQAQCWTAEYEQLDSSSSSLLRGLEDQVRAAVGASGCEIRAVLWHQGEGDCASVSATASANYYANLKHVIAYLRGVVGNARLPFVFGTIARASAGYDEAVDAAMRRIAREDPYAWLVDMADAALLDGYHFNAAWAEYLGKMAHDCLIDAGVISAAKLNPAKPS